MPTHPLILRSGLALAFLALPSQAAPCPEGSTACVRELPEDTQQGQAQILIQYTWQEAPAYNEQPGNLIIDSDGSVHAPATVRDPPPELSWGWVGIDVRDNYTPAGNMGYPSQIVAKMVCPRNAKQALAWISSASGTEDEGLVNRALSAYDWREGRDNQVEQVVDLVLSWPAGQWEQQYHYPEYEEEKPVGRYRFVSHTGEVYIWVRTVNVKGCWSVASSPPSQDAQAQASWEREEVVEAFDLPEQTQQDGNLYILWEAQEEE